MSDTDTRRWADRAWEVGLRILGVLLLAICTYGFVRLNEVEARTRNLEIKAAVTDEARNSVMMTLGEIKGDIKEIKESLSKRP